ncbi:ABC transporter ATP-binding protein [Candidatus Nitrosacidococcus sp. I8]|uniref:ABC transporter ATP-binding protein n=1 Tax=Candidatus Nitrosacidococcus sp. I8 TaxID=2942908 RepID=UPI002227435E|nr:ABC transporter ATP-binding protein [Candidatus Nitrosacidococcus sp. I8]CAH9015593.1 putative ABC transporter ATP-binding protein YadG [Candidatus Nitrosacidococcus sp. I8]
MDALVIENLQKVYRNQFTALRGINLRVAQGDFFALLGPNGAGKSTTIGILSSLVTKSAGKISVFGMDLDEQPEEVKSMIGLVPQEFNCNGFERISNILATQAGYYGIKAKTARINAEQRLKQLGLWEKRNEYSRNLSGGMKRRLMIARALVHNPKLLILDEPTAGVDIELRRSMWQFLRETNHAGTTIILTTHYLEEAEQLCRNIAIIDHGTIVENSSMRVLLEKLHQETLVLYLKQGMSTVPVISGYTLHSVDDTTLEVEIKKGDSLNHLFTGLSQAGIQVLRVKNKTNRLEELFVNLISKGNATAQ